MNEEWRTDGIDMVDDQRHREGEQQQLIGDLRELFLEYRRLRQDEGGHHAGDEDEYPQRGVHRDGPPRMHKSMEAEIGRQQVGFVLGQPHACELQGSCYPTTPSSSCVIVPSRELLPCSALLSFIVRSLSTLDLCVSRRFEVPLILLPAIGSLGDPHNIEERWYESGGDEEEVREESQMTRFVGLRR